MKLKMRHQIQPRENVPPRNKRVREEIQKFLLAVDSYPARVAKDPGVNFQQHLCSFFATPGADRCDQRFHRSG